MKSLTKVDFIVNGQVVKEADLASLYPPKPKAARHPEPYFKGWRVEGHPPGSLEQAKADAEAAMKAWEVEKVGKMPRPWNEDHWHLQGKRESARSKPYQIPEAAEQCAEMVRNAGWIDARVVEVKREP